MTEKIFSGFLMGGFECSTHRTRGGRRLDVISATRHDEYAHSDYQRLMDLGLTTARDGLRWHLIEAVPGVYDFSSLQKQAAAARETGIDIIWDLFHYGYPDHLNIFSGDFPLRFADFCRAAVTFLKNEINGRLLLCPVNEISSYSWAGGQVGVFYPFAKNRGNSLKRQLVSMNIAAIDAIRQIVPDTRFISTEPAIHVVGSPKNPAGRRAAEVYRQAQFQSLDMLRGRTQPELGGSESHLDVIGINYYVHNQWRHPKRQNITLGHKDYRPFHQILAEYHKRYGRPIFVAETGIEDDARPQWFRYICDEVRIAMNEGIPVHGICLYPIVNHPGWDDDRHCHNGLWDYLDDTNNRPPFQPLLDEIKRQQLLFAEKG